MCGKKADSDYCFQHKPKKALKTNSGIKQTTTKSTKNTDEMFSFFLDIWKKRKHQSEISGKYLGKEPLSIYFHHILPKEKYKEASLDEENIILLTWEEHDQVERDIFRYPKINELRDQLLNKYNYA